MKHLKAIDFFCIGFGAIVGVGWAVSINNWMVSSGGPIPAAVGYILVLLMMIPIAMCYCELVPMFPVAGGGSIFAYMAFNEGAAALSGWASYGAFIAIIPWEAIQITTLLSFLFPGLTGGAPLYTCLGSPIYPGTVLIGVLFSVVLFLINIRGLSSAATLQKALCVVLFCTALIGAAASAIGGDAANLRPVYDVSAPEIYGPGLAGVTHSTFLGGSFAIVASAAFFLAGFETIPQCVEDAGGDIRSVGKTVVLSVTMACLFYALLLICFGMGWPWQDFSHMARPAAATMFKYLYPGTLGVTLYSLIVVGAIAGLITTWNGFFSSSANLLMSMSRSLIMPAVFAKQNRRGVAVNGQLVCLALSVVGPLLGANLIDVLTCFSSAAFMLSWAITAWSLVGCRRKYPQMDRPYRIPGGIWTGIFAGVSSSAAFIAMFIKTSPCYIGDLSIRVFAVWIALGAALYLLGAKSRRALPQEERISRLCGGKDLLSRRSLETRQRTARES